MVLVPGDPRRGPEREQVAGHLEQGEPERGGGVAQSTGDVAVEVVALVVGQVEAVDEHQGVEVVAPLQDGVERIDATGEEARRAPPGGADRWSSTPPSRATR